MKPQFLLMIATGLSLAFAAGAQAGNDLQDLIQVEVLDGSVTKQGTYMSALRLTLPDGWKTYWRAPGDAGIPPEFSWSGSRNIEDLKITWPTPEVFLTNGYQTIGYENQLVLPLEITPERQNAPIRVRGRIDLGLCKDVCIPGKVAFDHHLDIGAERNPAIVAAMAQRPYTQKEAGVRSANCTISPTSDGLRLEARITMPSTGGPEIAVIESGSPYLWANETKTSRQGGVLIAATELINVEPGRRAASLDRSRLRITVLGRRHAVDIQGCTG